MFADSVDLAYINITIQNDTIQEFDESFTVVLTSVQGMINLSCSKKVINLQRLITLILIYLIFTQTQNMYLSPSIFRIMLDAWIYPSFILYQRHIYIGIYPSAISKK